MTGTTAPMREGDERAAGRAPRRAELVGIEAELLADERVERALRVLEDPVRRSRAASSGGEALGPVEAASSASSSSGIASISARSRAIWRSNSSRWLCIEMYSPAAMLNAPASRPAIPARRMKLGFAGRGAGDAHDERQVADEAVADPEDDRPQRPRPAATGASARVADLAAPTPAGDATPSRRLRSGSAGAASAARQISACSRSSAAIAATSGERPGPRRASSSSPSSALTRSATAASRTAGRAG